MSVVEGFSVFEGIPFLPELVFCGIFYSSVQSCHVLHIVSDASWQARRHSPI